MKKKILSVALLATSLFAANSFAQAPADNNSNTTSIENIRGKKMDKKGGKKNPYEGLTLTDAQKAQLQQLDEKRNAQRKQNAEAQKMEKQRNDSVQMAARKTAKKEYLEEVKAIIGPDQYVVFLENFYINGGNQGGKSMKQGPRDGKKDFAHNKDMKGRKDKGGKKDGKNRGAKQGNQTSPNATITQL